MLTLHFAEPYQVPRDVCPMPQAVEYNFVSQLRSANITFTPHEGPLGIKCCLNGREVYEVGSERYVVDATSYLVLNEGQRYASAMQGRKPVDSFCIWFRPSFAEQVLGGLVTPSDRLLDEPGMASRQPVQFYERVYPHDDVVSPRLDCVRRTIEAGKGNPGWLEEQFHFLLEDLLQAHRNVYRDIERLPAIRQATRVELYRRLLRAKDFLDASLEVPVTLPDVAAVACLSPHHFLRQFKHLFKETPHQYHRRRRLERAARLLSQTEQPVTQICYGLGFESLGSFSWLFRTHYGVAPTEYRAQFGSRRLVRTLAREPAFAHEMRGHTAEDRIFKVVISSPGDEPPGG